MDESRKSKRGETREFWEEANNEGENAVRGIARGTQELVLLRERPRWSCRGDPFQLVDILPAS